AYIIPPQCIRHYADQRQKEDEQQRQGGHIGQRLTADTTGGLFSGTFPHMLENPWCTSISVAEVDPKDALDKQQQCADSYEWLARTESADRDVQKGQPGEAGNIACWKLRFDMYGIAVIRCDKATIQRVGMNVFAGGGAR